MTIRNWGLFVRFRGQQREAGTFSFLLQLILVLERNIRARQFLAGEVTTVGWKGSLGLSLIAVALALGLSRGQ
jgi:hypothetical protein